MASIAHRPIKRNHIDCCDDPLILSKVDSTLNKIQRLPDYHNYHQTSRCCKRSSCDWSLTHRKKIKTTSEKKAVEEEKEKEKEKQYHCHVYLRLFPSTLKCSIDVIVKPVTDYHDDIVDTDSIFIAKTRIPKSIPSGVIRIRLVSSLFSADVDVCEDPSLCKFEKIQNQFGSNHFDKQYALVLKKEDIGPGVIGKLFVESLDPSSGSYTNNSPLIELNLNLSSKHEILFSSSHQNVESTVNRTSFNCGCFLCPDLSRVIISDQCNLTLNDTKLLNRLSDPLRCQWKSIGRELFPCFSEMDLIDLNQTYLLTDGNRECTFQLFREWFIRDPKQANVRHLLTKLKLSFDQIVLIHDQIIRNYS